MPSHPVTITRTIYDPALKAFVFDSPDGRAMPNIRQWIEKKNPVIYWYILRIGNPSELQLEQWAVELYTHQALNIKDAYIEGVDRRFELKKRERDPWSDKYVLSITRQSGIPIVGRGARRIYFKVDINCKEGLMHEYGVSGRFIAEGLEAVEVREKMFRYSCKVGEFRQIFNNNPDEASIYAEKRLSTRYSPGSVRAFTNSFRMIHELYRYCHSDSIKGDDLLYKLHLLHANFEKVPEIADEKINPLLNNGIKELKVLDMADMSEFRARYLRLCDSLVELLHIEVVGAKTNFPPAARAPSPEHQNTGNANGNPKPENGNRECPVCMNLIDSSNRSLLCGKCKTQFCELCESWFRDERKRGERPLCEDCFTAEQERLRKQKEEERIRKEQAEQESLRKQRKEERIRKEKAEQERLRKQREEEEKRKLKNSIGMEFVKISAGNFMMGSPQSEEGRYGDEGPLHKVTIRTPFYLGKCPVIQKQWKAVMGSNPSHFKGDDNPVENVSWDDVQKFIKKLNQMEGTDEYRLPSEAEWEYACRAGTTTRYYFGDDESTLKDYAWCRDNSDSETHSVGQKKPNPWGLYDMHGNVWEWCQDRWHSDYDGASFDGSAWEDGSGSYRVQRGGSWRYNARGCRSANRSSYDPGDRFGNLGFRLLRKL